MFDLSGKVAWVTGSTRNLGRAIVEDLAKQGANVAVSNRSDSDALDRAVDQIRDEYDTEVTGVRLDVGDPDQVSSAVETITEEIGSVDILVNNAAVRPHQPIEEITLSDWNRVIQTNMTGAFLCTRAVLPEMKDQQWGRIISISGVDAFQGSSNRVHSTSAKAGLIGFTRSLTTEISDFDITANCIAPGAFDTTRPDEWYPDLDQVYELNTGTRILAGRLGDPHELSPAVVFLASEEASYITGQVLHVNGGKFPVNKSLESVVDEFSIE